MEGVVAGAQEGYVVALIAVDEIAAVATEKDVDAVAAANGVVAGAAVDRDADKGRQIAGGAETVVAAVHVEDEVFGGADIDAERSRVDPVKAHARAVGGDREVLGAAAAIDLGDIFGAAAAFVEVGVVARVPNHAVVAAFAEHLVVVIATGQRVVVVAAEQKIEASFAEEGIVARLSEQLVVARAAGEGVVALAAEEVGARQRAVALVERDRVVPAQAEPLDQAGIGHRRGAALDDHRAAVDENVAGGIAADRDRIVEGIAEYRQHARSGGKTRGNSHGPNPLSNCAPSGDASVVRPWCAAAAIGSGTIARAAAADGWVFSCRSDEALEGGLPLF